MLSLSPLAEAASEAVVEAAHEESIAASMEVKAVPEAELVSPSDTPPPALDDGRGAVQKNQVGRQEA